MSVDETLNAYFVTVGTTTDDNEFATAQRLLRNHITEDHIRSIKASEGFALIASGRLTKQDVFVFNRFEGDFFNQLRQQTKSLLIGPRCLTTCLLRCEPIPLGTSPVFTTAMRDLQISATGIPAKEKERLRVFIQWMGGHYFPDFGRSITHLISNTVKSTKYEQATIHGIAVMHVDWVERVWERSCAADVNATDQEFDKYRLPIFFGANITCSGLTNEKKNQLAQLINENGGTYHACFRSQIVDIVITERNKTNSDKYKAAVRFKKDVLLPEWVFDSVEKGFALPTKVYVVKALNASTPTKDDQSVAEFSSADNTQLSDVSRHSKAGARANLMTSINDTVCSVAGPAAGGGEQSFAMPSAHAAGGSAASDLLQRAVLKKSLQASHYRLVLEEISLKQARKAGSFLDGCCIYLSGFRADEREKLNRILNVGGATRYDAVTEKITHIIVGELDDADYRSWRRDGILSGTHIVRLNWLLESIKAQQPASEAVYRMSLPSTAEPDAPSPSSKKTLRSMNHSFKQPDMPIKKKLFDAPAMEEPSPIVAAVSAVSLTNLPQVASTKANEEHNLIAQYSQELLSEGPAPVPLPPARSMKSLNPPPRPSTAANDTMANLAVPIASSTQCTPNMTGLGPTAGVTPANETEMTTTNTIDYDNLNFLDGRTLYVYEKHFRDELLTQIMYECEAAKADLVTSKFRDTVDYAVVSFEHVFCPAELPVQAKQVVNDLYVETCLKQNCFAPIEYYHRPIPQAANARPLVGMTIVVSIYTELERDFIDSLAELLGARVNKTFVKKERPLLVCPQAEGSKYQGAIKWGYPVVTAQWLQECAEQGIKLPFTAYLVGNSVSEFPISPTLRERNVEVTPPPALAEAVKPMEVDGGFDAVENNPQADATNSSTLLDLMERDNQDAATTNNNNIKSPAGNTTTTPTDFTPLRNRRVSELAGPLNRSLSHRIATPPQYGNISSEGSSPRTPSNMMVEPTYDLEIMESMLGDIADEAQRECMRDIINDIRNNPTPQLERIRRQACTPNVRGNNRWPSPKGVPDFCTTPAFKQRMVEEFEKRHVLPTKKLKPDTPIGEIFRRVLYATCRAQGIHVSDDEEDSQELQDEISQQPPPGKNQTKTPAERPSTSKSLAGMAAAVVTPQQRYSNPTPRALFEQPGMESPLSHKPSPSRMRDSASFVPSTQTPNMSGRHEQSARVSPAAADKSTINFDKISFEETQLSENHAGQRTASPGMTAVASPVTSLMPEVQQITDYLKECQSRRQSFKRSANGSVTSSTSASNSRDGDQLADRHATRPGGETQAAAGTEGHFVQAFESEQFAGAVDMVGWQDPLQFSAQRRSKAKVAAMQHRGSKPRFSISCSQDNVRQEMIAKIHKLGGVVSENLINYDPDCSHFLCEKLNRGEKTLGCIAAGKWVLSLLYIEESYAEGAFVDEELYEWGNSKAIVNNPPLTTVDEENIAMAAHRWRRELRSTDGVGAFSGFRCILRISERHLLAFQTVIQAGKGVVVATAAPYTRKVGAHLATHCFVDVKKNPLKMEDHKFLTQNNVQILSQMYINDYLIHGRNVDKSHLIIKM